MNNELIFRDKDGYHHLSLILWRAPVRGHATTKVSLLSKKSVAEAEEESLSAREEERREPVRDNRLNNEPLNLFNVISLSLSCSRVHL